MEIGMKKITLQTIIMELSSIENAINAAFKGQLKANNEDWTEFGKLITVSGDEIQLLVVLAKASSIPFNSGTKSMLFALSKWIPNSQLRFDAGRLKATYMISV